MASVEEVARELASKKRWLSLAMLVAGYAGWDYPLSCYECRRFAEEASIRLLREAGLRILAYGKRLVDELAVIAWPGDSARVLVFIFAHGRPPEIRSYGTLAHALHALREWRLKLTKDARSYVTEYADIIEKLGPREEAERLLRLVSRAKG